MTLASDGGATGEFARFLAWVLASSLVLGLLGIWPTGRLGGEGAVAAMALALAVAAAGSVAGGIPVLLARRQGSAKPHVVLVSMLVRLLAVTVLATSVLLAAKVEMTPFLLWLAGGYLALLAVDTRYAMRLSESL